MPNYAFTAGNELPVVGNGHVFEYRNFTQKLPHTKIFEGVTGLKFKKCNLTNCDLPGDAVTEGCTHTHKTFCTNLNPRWIDKGIVACVENCTHVIDTDVITIDGIVVDTVYHYENTRV